MPTAPDIDYEVLCRLFRETSKLVDSSQTRRKILSILTFRWSSYHKQTPPVSREALLRRHGLYREDLFLRHINVSSEGSLVSSLPIYEAFVRLWPMPP